MLKQEGFLQCQTPTPTPTVRLKVKGCRVKNGGCGVESEKTLGIGLKAQSRVLRTVESILLDSLHLVYGRLFKQMSIFVKGNF